MARASWLSETRPRVRDSPRDVSGESMALRWVLRRVAEIGGGFWGVLGVGVIGVGGADIGEGVKKAEQKRYS